MCCDAPLVPNIRHAGTSHLIWVRLDFETLASRAPSMNASAAPLYLRHAQKNNNLVFNCLLTTNVQSCMASMATELHKPDASKVYVRARALCIVVLGQCWQMHCGRWNPSKRMPSNNSFSSLPMCFAPLAVNLDFVNNCVKTLEPCHMHEG